MPKWTPEQKAERQRIVNAKLRVRNLLIEGREADALECARENGFDLFAARLDPEYQNPAEPFFAAIQARYKAEEEALEGKTEPAVAEVAVAVAADGDEARTNIVGPDLSGAAMAFEEQPEMVNGWPVLVSAQVWGFPRNQNMVTIELPDGRRAAMWKARRRAYRIYMKLQAKLVAAEADPIYEELVSA